jgi:hypothetical protein
MADGDDKAEGFAGRWSRLKAESRAVGAPAPEIEREAPAVVPAGEEETLLPARQADAIEEKPPELPPLETLTRDSDFSLFMRPDVGADIRTQALRKLWTLDTHFASIDITECHSIDFNAVPTFPEGLKNTIYRVGSGMVEAVEEIERAEAEKAKLAAAKAAEADSPADDAESAPELPRETT